ncbi:mitotic spindle assembly checkpoint protein MAD2A-like [Notothenia coriiceps]|uniref:Mitotic spindle assembly checkpoint protein MAD2A-like n=1 Tax=Notothenia coriiceps TaxID=8208 RepID=A0A6I9MYV7_9TELE|nr:PREDICTED: mitotic spindle assembly checkpoint protein MAD2A-like [Notothenia coriiceps]
MESQLKEWLFECTVQKFVLVITCLETNEVLERWQFDIDCDKSAKESSAPREKSIKIIQDEIRSVIRQITATVTFLPLLETPCEYPDPFLPTNCSRPSSSTEETTAGIQYKFSDMGGHQEIINAVSDMAGTSRDFRNQATVPFPPCTCS